MADAGLTNGAFYAHFDSKNDLVATAVAEQLREQPRNLLAAAWGRRRGAGARVPLGPASRRPRARLPVRRPARRDRSLLASTKQAYTEGVVGIADEISARFAPDDPESARAATLSLFALLIGTLQLSRALADRQLADAVLERGIENALALLSD